MRGLVGRANLCICAFFVTLACGRHASGEPTSVGSHADLRDFQIGLDPALAVGGPAGAGEGTASRGSFDPTFSLVGLYAANPLERASLATASGASPPTFPRGAQWSADATVAVGIGERVQAGFALPVVLGSDVRGPAAVARGMGDLALVAKYTLRAPRPPFGVGLAVVQRVTIPTGEPATLAAEPGAVSETRMIGEGALGALRAAVSAGLRLRAVRAEIGCEVSGGPETCASRPLHSLPLGASVAFGSGQQRRSVHWKFWVDASGRVALGSSDADAFGARTLRAGLGASIAVGEMWFGAGVDRALLQAASASPLRAWMGVAFAPDARSRGDADGDGVANDLCEDLPEDRDGFQDDDGCPDRDNDGDGVPDEVDVALPENERVRLSAR